MTYQDGVFDINPDKLITGRTFEYCHACGEEITTVSEDYPWCSEACLERLREMWLEEYNEIMKTTNTTKGRASQLKEGLK